MTAGGHSPADAPEDRRIIIIVFRSHSERFTIGAEQTYNMFSIHKCALTRVALRRGRENRAKTRIEEGKSIVCAARGDWRGRTDGGAALAVSPAALPTTKRRTEPRRKGTEPLK